MDHKDNKVFRASLDQLDLLGQLGQKVNVVFLVKKEHKEILGLLDNLAKLVHRV